MNYSCEGEYEASIAAEAEAEAEATEIYHNEIKRKIKALELELKQAKNDIDLFADSSIDFPYEDNIKQCDKVISELYFKMPKLEIKIAELKKIIGE